MNQKISNEAIDFRTYRSVVKFVKDRGLTVSPREEYLSESEDNFEDEHRVLSVEKGDSTPYLLNISRQHKVKDIPLRDSLSFLAYDEHEIMIIWFISVKASTKKTLDFDYAARIVEDLGLQDQIQQGRRVTIVMISQIEPTSDHQLYIDAIKRLDQMKLQLFLDDNFISSEMTSYHPIYEKVGLEEYDRNFNPSPLNPECVDVSKLPVMSLDDPVCKYRGFSSGDIIKVLRKSFIPYGTRKSITYLRVK
jgi:hypothetical protein